MLPAQNLKSPVQLCELSWVPTERRRRLLLRLPLDHLQFLYRFLSNDPTWPLLKQTCSLPTRIYGTLTISIFSERSYMAAGSMRAISPTFYSMGICMEWVLLPRRLWLPLTLKLKLENSLIAATGVNLKNAVLTILAALYISQYIQSFLIYLSCMFNIIYWIMYLNVHLFNFLSSSILHVYCSL